MRHYVRVVVAPGVAPIPRGRELSIAESRFEAGPDLGRVAQSIRWQQPDAHLLGGPAARSTSDARLTWRRHRRRFGSAQSSTHWDATTLRSPEPRRHEAARSG